MTSIGIQSEEMESVVAPPSHRRRGPYKPRVPVEELPIDFSRMDVKTLERITKQDALEFSIEGEWVVVVLATCRVRFRQWKSV